MGATTNLHISLSPQLREQIEDKVQRHHYTNVTEYVRSVVRADLVREAESVRLRELLEEGLNSPVSEKSTEVFFGELRTRISEHARVNVPS